MPVYTRDNASFISKSNNRMIMAWRNISVISAYVAFGINESSNYAGRKVSSQPALANLSIDVGRRRGISLTRVETRSRRRRRTQRYATQTRPSPRCVCEASGNEAGVFLGRGGGGRRECLQRRGNLVESLGCAAQTASNNKCEGVLQVPEILERRRGERRLRE